VLENKNVYVRKSDKKSIFFRIRIKMNVKYYLLISVQFWNKARINGEMA